MITPLILTGGAFYLGRKAFGEFKKSHIRLSEVASKKLQKLAANRFDLSGNMPYRLGVTTTAMACATAGALIYPPLSLASIPALLYLSLPSCQRAYQTWVAERRLSAALPKLAITGVCLLNGHYVAPAMIFWLTNLQDRFLQQLEAKERQRLLALYRKIFHQGQCQPGVGGVEATNQADDLIQVAAGHKIPATGVIVEGSALIKQVQRVGESEWFHGRIGDVVCTGMRVDAGQICVKVQPSAADALGAEIESPAEEPLSPAWEVATRAALPPHPAAQAIQDQIATPALGFGALVALLLNPISAVALMQPALGAEIEGLTPLIHLQELQMAAQARILLKTGVVLAALQEVDTLVLDRAASLRLEAGRVIQTLRQEQIRLVAVLSDGEKPLTNRYLREIGVDQALVVNTTEEKIAALAQLRAAGRRVCYVGDGCEKRGIWQQVDVAISLHSTTHLDSENWSNAPLRAENPAQVILLDANLNQMIALFTLAKMTAQRRTATFGLTYAPAALNLATVLLLHSGPGGAVLLTSVGWLAALGYTYRGAGLYLSRRSELLTALHLGWTPGR